MALSSEVKVKTIRIGDIAQDSDAIKYPLWKLKRRIKISAVLLGANVACAAADTNYNTFALTDVTNTIASVANGPVSGGTSFVAGSMHAMTVVAAHQEKAAGTQLQLEVTKTGNGLALTGAQIQIEYQEYDA